MRKVQYAQRCENYVGANSKISRPKVDVKDFIKLTNLAEDINKCHYLANNISWGGITVPFSEIEWPRAFAGMIYPRAVTATGDYNTEADVLKHSFDGMIDLAKAVTEEVTEDGKTEKKVTNQSELDSQQARFETIEEFNLFVNRLYGTFKKAAETEKVSDLRAAASLTAENVKRLYVQGPNMGVSGSMTAGLFPWNSKFEFKHEDEALKTVDKALDDFLRLCLQTAATNN